MPGPVTNALHFHVESADAHPTVTPLFQSSAFHADSKFFYSRKDNPNVSELESVVRILEEAQYSIAVSTGMAAIALATGLLRAGDTLVVNKLIYGCSYRQFQRLAGQRGIKVEIRDLAADSEPLPDGTAMVFFETPTNPFLRTIDIQRISDEAHARNPKALVVVDNTWATPLFQHPLEWGADLSIHSATKFFSGHSDVMGGFVLTNRADLHDALREERFYSGANLDPHSAWLLRRSLQTLALRMRAHQETTLRMVAFLAKRPEVAEVYFPEIDGRQLKGYGGLIFFQLREELRERYRTFRDALTLFDTGTGMAAVTSMVAQPYSGSHASMTPDEKESVGLDVGLVRLSFGLEDPLDLESDLAQAFDKIAEIADAETQAAAATGRSRVLIP